MKKKSVILTLTVGCASLSAFALALTSQSGFATLFAKTRSPRTHLIQFTPDELKDLGLDDEDHGYHNFRLQRLNAFKDVTGTDYNLSSVDGSTYFYYSGELYEMEVGGDHFLSFVCYEQEHIGFQFKFKGAYLTENSYFELSREYYDEDLEQDVNEYLGQVTYTNSSAAEDGYTYYTFFHYFSDNYSETIYIDSFQLEFTCE